MTTREIARHQLPKAHLEARDRPARPAPGVNGERLSAFYAAGPAVSLAAPMGRAGDRWEREADDVTDKVTQGQQAPEVSRPPAGALGAQRQAEGETNGSHSGLEDQIRSLQGAGEPLPAGPRAFFEGRFNRDFRETRIHRDARASELVAAVRARAFTAGHNIAFGAGEFAPETRGGRYLLAHELVHVAQGSSSASSPLIRRFASEEHRQLGHEATGGAITDLNIGTTASPQFLTYGEMVALAGDYFGSLQEMRDLATTAEGREQLLWARWWALRAGAEPSVSEAAKQAVRDRYFRLAAQNVSHFSAGGTARNEYQRYHQQALELAFRSGINGSQTLWDEARTTEAFGHHFLTDMFAGGHVRTPRSAIRAWYQSHYPDSINRFVTYMARHMRAYLQRAHSWANFFGQIPSQADIEARIRSIGGTALGSFSLGDIVSLAFHDRDNTGLGVISDVNESGTAVPGGFHFTALGDSRLSSSPTTRNMALSAMRASLGDLDAMRQAAAAVAPHRPPQAPGPEPDFQGAFNRALAGLTPFVAERFVPREDPGAGNAAMVWEWGSFNGEMRSAVQAAIRGEVVGVLRDRAHSQTDANVRDALNDFATHLDLQNIQAIEAAIGATAGP